MKSQKIKSQLEFYREMQNYTDDELEATRSALKFQNFINKHSVMFTLILVISFILYIGIPFLLTGNKIAVFYYALGIIISYPFVYYFYLRKSVNESIKEACNEKNAYEAIMRERGKEDSTLAD